MIRGVGSSLVSLLAFGAGRALFLLAVARFYGPSTLGVVVLATTIMVLLAIVLGVASEPSAAFLTGRNPERIPTLRGNAARLGMASAVCSVPLLLLLAAVLGEAALAEFGPLAWSALPLMIGGQVAQHQIQGIQVGLGDFRGVTRGHVLHHGALLLGTVLLIALGLPGQAVLPLYAGTLILKAWYQASTLPRGQRARAGEAPWHLLVEQARHGVHMMLGNLVNLLNYRLDSLFIAYFLGPRDVGLYAAATTVAEATLYLPRGISQAAFSWSSSLQPAEPADPDRRKTVRRLFVRLAVAGALLASAVALVVPLLLPALFGRGFTPSVDPARILLAAAFFNGLGLLAMGLLHGTGQARLNSRAGAIAALLNAAANATLIPRFGIQGAAIGSLLSYGAYAGLSVTALKASLRGQWRGR